VGAIGILPFVWQEIPQNFREPANWPLMIFASLAMLITALVVFQGLKLGKLSVVLPINGIELAVAILLAITIGQERYPAVAFGYMLIVAIGLVLTGVTAIDDLKRLKWEKGVAFAIIGAFGLGLNDFVIGFASRQLSPLFIVWLTSLACALGALAIMLARSHLPHIRRDFRSHFNLIIAQSFLDNFAWICFAYSATLIPIGIATTVSEGYLALGALLGVLINREHLRPHQYAGVCLTIAGVISLSIIAN
jgi:drug/metabolite transporter (DMT)-like permease